MSYTINYSTGSVRKYPKISRKKGKRRIQIAVAAGIFAIIVTAFHIRQVRHFLLPGDPVITERAIVKMVDELQAGESIEDAFAVFCREVIDGGKAE